MGSPLEGYNPSTDVFLFTGTSGIKKGTGVCFVDTTVTTEARETATDPYGGRLRRVALPSATNCQKFAGWVINDHNPHVLGNTVRVALAESAAEVEVRAEVPTTYNSTYLTPSINTGAEGVCFIDGGLSGRGRVLAVQSQANKTSATDTTPGPVCQGFDAVGSITTAGVLTHVGKFTYAAAGDRIIILAAAGAAGAAITGTVLGEFVIASRDSADQVTLTGYSGSATAIISYYVVRGYPWILARADSETRQTGLCEIIQPLASTAVNPTTAVGTTFNAGGTLTAADSTGTLADAGVNGQRKLIGQLAALVTNNYELTLTSCVAPNGAAMDAVSTVTFDGAGDFALFEWHGTFNGVTTGQWVLQNALADAIA
jgi:hypothetical protein